MNTPLRRVGIAMLAMIVLLLANTTYIQVVKADGYRQDARNQRVLLDEYARERGHIVSQFGGTILARGERTTDRLRFLRVYEDGPLYAPVTGYYSWRYGSGGLERAHNDFLNGNDPRLFVRRLSDMITGRDPRGGHLQLTINPTVQKAAYDAMTSRGYRGAVVALEPSTGRILAMVSTPSFDPNKLASHDGRVQEDAWTEWNCDRSQSGCDHENPMRNRAIQELYPPGSTFKLVVTAAALEDGADADTRVTRDGVITLPGTQTPLPNYGGSTCRGSTLKDALAYSCNTAFAVLAGELGKEKLSETSERFGIGMDSLEIPMPVARSQLGDLDNQAAIYQSGIGQQSVRITPMQDAMLAATIANRGITMKPQLMRELQAPDLSTIQEIGPEELGTSRALSERNADILRDMMISSERNTRGSGGGLSIASKTGTAQHGSREDNRPPHSWYTAFAPADDPQIAIAVIVESRGFGADHAAPVGREVIRAALEGN